jgi:hypothetical protein
LWCEQKGFGKPRENLNVRIETAVRGCSPTSNTDVKEIEFGFDTPVPSDSNERAIDFELEAPNVSVALEENIESDSDTLPDLVMDPPEDVNIRAIYEAYVEEEKEYWSEERYLHLQFVRSIYSDEFKETIFRANPSATEQDVEDARSVAWDAHGIERMRTDRIHRETCTSYLAWEDCRRNYPPDKYMYPRT